MFKVAPVLFFKYFHNLKVTLIIKRYVHKCLMHLENAKNLICTPEIFIGHKKIFIYHFFFYAMKTLYVCLI